MTYPRYPAYKDSGVEWLGDIPNHWETYRYRRLFAEVVDRSESEDEELLTVSHLTGVTPRSEKNVNMFLAESLEDYKWCQKGDTVINTMWAWMGALGVAFQPGVVSPSYNVYRPRPKMASRLAPRYFDFLYRTEAHIAEVNRFSKGVWASRLRLYPQSFFEITTVCPPLAEQRAIAAFLDAETAQIDGLVARQEALIAALQEKRRALISHAVTKGLDPTAPMRDSGVPWLGEVPTHWDVKRLARVAYLHRGYDLPADDRTEGIFPVVTSGGIVDSHDKFKARGPGVAMGRYGTTGDIFYIEQDYWPHNTALFVEEFHGNRPRYIYYLLQILPYDAHSGKSAVPGIDRNDLHVLHVCEPPVDEQQAIELYLDYETTKIDTLIAKAQALIGLLRERRTALIAAAVTGQIDVRGWGG